MKFHLILTLLISAAVPALAAIARQQNTGHYTSLLNNSPFTLPPVKVKSGGDEPIASALDDWTLAGILPLGDSYFVTLRHKKEAGKSEMLRGSKKSPLGFELVSVVQDANPEESRVKIRYQGKEHWMNFDLKALGVAEPKPLDQNAGAKGNKASNQRGARPPGIPRAGGRNDKSGQTPVRRPRPRVIRNNN